MAAAPPTATPAPVVVDQSLAVVPAPYIAAGAANAAAGALVVAGAPGAVVPVAEPKYDVLNKQIPEALSDGERGARELLARKMQRGYADFKKWFGAHHQNALGNWQLRPPGHPGMPKNPADPLPPNPNVSFSGRWEPTPYGSDSFKFECKVLNIAAVRQPGMPDEPGMCPLSIKLPPMVISRGSVGPNPRLVFQQVVSEGRPLGSVTSGFALLWTHVAQRQFNMDASFHEYLEFTKILEEEIVAWLARSGDKCVVSQMRFALTAPFNPMTPTQAYIHFLEKARKIHPAIEYPPCRVRKMVNGKLDYQDEKGSESPFAPQMTFEVAMGSGNMVKKDERDAALKAFNYSYGNQPDAKWAEAIMQNGFGHKYVHVHVTRPEMRLSRDGRCAIVDTPLEKDDCLRLITTNAVVSVNTEFMFKPNKSEKEEDRDKLYAITKKLTGIQYWGTTQDYHAEGYVRGKIEIARTATIEFDDDVAAVALRMQSYAKEPTSVQLYEDADPLNDDDYEAIMKMYNDGKKAAEVKGATPADGKATDGKTAASTTPITTTPAGGTAAPAPTTLPAPVVAVVPLAGVSLPNGVSAGMMAAVAAAAAAVDPPVSQVTPTKPTHKAANGSAPHKGTKRAAPPRESEPESTAEEEEEEGAGAGGGDVDSLDEEDDKARTPTVARAVKAMKRGRTLA